MQEKAWEAGAGRWEMEGRRWKEVKEDLNWEDEKTPEGHKAV
jgi:hypothetical protein